MASLFAKHTGFSFPTYLLPTMPLRRGVRSDSTTSSASAVSASSVDSSVVTGTSIGTSSKSSSSNPSDGPLLLPGTTSCIRCRRCAAELCMTDQIVSCGFTGRFGRAYLVASLGGSNPPSFLSSSTGLPPDSLGAPSAIPRDKLANTKTLKPEPRNLVTGAHVVSNVECACCGIDLGWKYVHAEEESQRYKIGKYILETARVTTTPRWESDSGFADGRMIGGRRLEDVMAPDLVDGELVEFDSADEDECEDLFLGQWTPQQALKRRKAKGFMGLK